MPRASFCTNEIKQMMQYHVVTHFFQSTDIGNEGSAVSVFVLRCKNKHDKQRSAMSGATDFFLLYIEC